MVYVSLGALDECCKWVERAFRAQTFFGWIRFDPLMEKVRKDSRFNELLRGANLPLQPVN